MKILLTNDDGVTCQGIQVISGMLSEKGWLGAVVAPDRERSGAGHSITVDRPLRIHPLDPGMFPSEKPAYSCDGTPTDCVAIGLDALFPTADFVVSGVNQGPNISDDVTYSGTVCAAMEGILMGRPAIAVSLCLDGNDRFKHNITAALAAMAVLSEVEKNPLPPDVLLNVNVPNELIKNIKGFRITKRGKRKFKNKIACLKDPRGNDSYWIAGEAAEEHEEGTDVTAVSEGYVSVTPIKMDMTDYSMFDDMSSRNLGEKFARNLNLAL
jgi:5'-nucleotidase